MYTIKRLDSRSQTQRSVRQQSQTLRYGAKSHNRCRSLQSRCELQKSYGGTYDSLDDRVTGEEGVVLLRELLNWLLLLVELLQRVNIVLVHAQLLSLGDVDSVSKNCDLHVRPWAMRELHGTSETLVLLGVIVFETNLELDRFLEVALLLLGLRQDGLDGLAHSRGRELRRHREQGPGRTLISGLSELLTELWLRTSAAQTSPQAKNSTATPTLDRKLNFAPHRTDGKNSIHRNFMMTP